MTEAMTQPSERRDFREWHRGRGPYVFWALDVDSLPVRRRLAAHVRRLGPLLLEGYVRQPHVTLDICGFPSLSPQLDDEFGRDLLDVQLSALRCAQPKPFRIVVGQPASFRSAPYLSVDDVQGGIARLRACLAINGEHRLLGDYVPHVTIGLFAEVTPLVEVVACLAAEAAADALSVAVERLSLMSYEPAEIGGRLDCLAEYRLTSGQWIWRDAAASRLPFLAR